MRKVLNQQEVDFVVIGICVLLFVQVVGQQISQSFLARKRRGLQKLAQLVDVDAFIHVQQPLPSLFDRFLRRSCQAGLQITAGRQLDDELFREGSIQGVKRTRLLPFGGKIADL